MGSQEQIVTLLLSNATKPAASSLPETLTPFLTVMSASVRRLPANTVDALSVAELPTCQKTLPLQPPLVTITEEPAAVVSVVLILKIQTALASSAASSKSVPVNCADDEKQ